MSKLILFNSDFLQDIGCTEFVVYNLANKLSKIGMISSEYRQRHYFNRNK